MASSRCRRFTVASREEDRALDVLTFKALLQASGFSSAEGPPFAGPVLSYWTFAVRAALPFSVNVQVRRFSPPLEHAPDQIASRPLVTLSVIDVPALNVALPVVPTATLIPEGLESTRSPLRPVAVTVSVADCPGGFTVNVADFATPA